MPEVMHAKAFKTCQPPAARQCWVLYRRAKGPFPNDCFALSYLKPEANTLGTRSKCFSQENNFFSTSPLISPIKGNEIQCEEVRQGTDSILPHLAFCLKVSWLVHHLMWHNTNIQTTPSCLWTLAKRFQGSIHWLTHPFSRHRNLKSLLCSQCTLVNSDRLPLMDCVSWWSPLCTCFSVSSLNIEKVNNNVYQ